MQARAFALITTAILLLAAALAGSADDIDNCCFVDRQCTTDQQWVDGYWAFQNNQCPGSTQSQTAASVSSQPAGGAPAQVDNCCFVDRQCSTNQDWIDGYWAFQNNQCPGSAPAQTAASSQPAGGVILRTASGVVIGSTSGRSILPTTAPTVFHTDGQRIIYGPYHNCCQKNWQCDSDQDWAEGYRVFQNNSQCALPGLISIVGDPDFVAYYEQRLDLLKNRLPHRYTYVLDGLNKIEQSRIEGKPSNLDPTLRTFFVAWEDEGPAHTGWEIRESAVLVHEACHVHRHDAGYNRGSSLCDLEVFVEEEVICREMELQVLIELDAEPHIIEWAHGMVADTPAGIRDELQRSGCDV